MNNIKAMFEQTERHDDIVANIMKKLRLVNRHWSLCATRASELLRPPNVPLRTMLTMVVKKLVNLRYLKLENVNKIGDGDLVNLGKLSLICLSFTPYKYHYFTEITDRVIQGERTAQVLPREAQVTGQIRRTKNYNYREVMFIISLTSIG